MSEVLAATITGVILGPALCAVLDPTALSSDDDIWFQIFQQVSSQPSTRLPGMLNCLRISEETRQDVATCGDTSGKEDCMAAAMNHENLRRFDMLVADEVQRAPAVHHFDTRIHPCPTTRFRHRSCESCSRCNWFRLHWASPSCTWRSNGSLWQCCSFLVFSARGPSPSASPSGSSPTSAPSNASPLPPV